MQEVDVAVAVIVANGKCWVQQRQESGLLNGCWEFPGGKVEPGETVIEALIREVQEEVGLDIPPKVPRLMHTERHADRDRRVCLHFFFCGLSPTEVCSLKGGEWIPLGQLTDQKFPPANRKVLEMLRSGPTV